MERLKTYQMRVKVTDIKASPREEKSSSRKLESKSNTSHSAIKTLDFSQVRQSSQIASTRQSPKTSKHSR